MDGQDPPGEGVRKFDRGRVRSDSSVRKKFLAKRAKGESPHVDRNQKRKTSFIVTDRHQASRGGTSIFTLKPIIIVP